jgi:membrane protein required for colicin V production
MILTPVDWGVIVILIISIICGFAQGFFRSACGLFGLLIGLSVASWNYHRVAGSLLRFITIESVANIIAFLLIFILVVAIAGLIGHLLAKAFHLIGLGWLDSLAGGVFGIFQGAVIITIIIMVCVAFLPLQSQWLTDAQLPRQFFSFAHVSSHMTPTELGDRVRTTLHTWENKSSEWLHQVQH